MASPCAATSLRSAARRERVVVERLFIAAAVVLARGPFARSVLITCVVVLCRGWFVRPALIYLSCSKYGLVHWFTEELLFRCVNFTVNFTWHWSKGTSQLMDQSLTRVNLVITETDLEPMGAGRGGMAVAGRYGCARDCMCSNYIRSG